MHLLITARFITPPVFHVDGGLFPFDAILLAAKGNRDGVSEGMEKRLPIKKKRFRLPNGEEDWLYLCSDAFIVPPYDVIQVVCRRVGKDHRWEEYYEGRAKINKGSGLFRLFELRRPAIVAREMAWMVETNDEDELLDLLDWADFVGAWTAKGFGEVAKWNCREPKRPWSLFDEEDRPIRSVPLCALNDGENNGAVAERAWRSPYYASPRAPCLVPVLSDAIMSNKEDRRALQGLLLRPSPRQ